MENMFDMIVIGGGAGGYTAALYAARAGLSVIVIDKAMAGGQMLLTQDIDNYPGFANGVDGFTLSDQFKKQAERFGALSKMTTVKSVELNADTKVIHCEAGDYFAKTVVIASGAIARPLGLDHEAELLGKGVSYCGTCDGMFYRNKKVVVVGGGNTAAEDALLLARVASDVTLIHRRDQLRAEHIYDVALRKEEKVKFAWDSVVDEILFDDKVKGVRVRNVKTNEISEIECEGLFISVGRIPVTDYLQDQITLDGGYVKAGDDTLTNIPGVFAVGDVRTKEVRQVVTAAADGAVAVHHAQNYLAKQS